MKYGKKIVSLMLTLVMLAAMTLTAGAADGTTYTITVNDTKAGHTYGAYQIFSGDLSDGVLSNIEWGTGVNGTALLSALKAADATAYDGCTTAAEVAKKLEEKKDDAAFVAAFAKVAVNNLNTASATAQVAEDATSCALSNLQAGYYLVKDTETVTGNDAATAVILRVVANVTVSPKSSVPTLTKKVKDFDDAWQDGANYAIGSHVPFKLTGTMPSTLDTYTTYSYTFHDTLSTGLTFDAGSVKVTLGDQDITSSFTVTTEGLADGCSLEVTCANVKGITGVTKDSAIVVEYTATLNEQAVIAGVGNPNEAHLEFSNNPNGTGTGTTPTDKVTVFTFELVANKVDGDNSNAALTGAQFTLKKKKADDSYEDVKTLGADGMLSAFTFTGLAAGDYRLVEDTAPKGYNSIQPIDFKVVAVYDKDSADSKLTSLTVEGTNADATFTVNKNGQGADATFTNITTQVVNHKGSTLPSTGGIGTTMFYVIGAILVVGAAILLITKRRMSCEK